MKIFICLHNSIIGHYFVERKERKILDAFQKKLDALEEIPVSFNTGVAVVDNNVFLEADAIVKSLKKYRFQKTTHKLNQVALRAMALKYRCKKGTKKDFSNYNKLQDFASGWKKLSDDPKKELDNVQIEQIKETCKYSEFSTLLLIDKNLRNDFFKWALRDNNSVKAFVYFPATCKKLKTCLMAGRIGRLSKDFLKVQKRKERRILTLPFEIKKNERKEINILNVEKRVTLRCQRTLTIRQIFQEFANKNTKVGDIEIFGVNGISNWNTLLLARKGPGGYKFLDLTIADYWKKMPVFEEITEQDILKRYGKQPDFSKKEWFVAVKSTRDGNRLDLDKSHGYLDVLMPSEKEGVYRLFPFGKFAARFPTGLLEKGFFVTDTVVAKIEYPDENSFYSHRQQGVVSFVINEEKGKKLMEMIKKELLSARAGNVVFMFSWENCAWWPQIILEKLLKDEEKVPNFFKTHLLTSRPSLEPLKTFFKFLRILPNPIRLITMKLFRYPFRCKRGVWVKNKRGEKIFKSSMNSPFAQKFNIYLPSILQEKILKKEIDGKVLFGNTIYRKGG